MKHQKYLYSFFLFLSLFLVGISGIAGTFTSTTTTPSWVTTTGWSISGSDLGTVGPGGDDIVINNNITLGANLSVTSLVVNSGFTFDLGSNNFTVTGASSISGILNDGNSAGANSYTGAVTINSGGTYSPANSTSTFNGGIINNGTFSTSGTASSVFAGTQSLSGGNFTFGGSPTVSSGTLTAAGNFNINIIGTLSISTGAIFDISQSNFSCGVIAVNGTLNDGNALGSNSFGAVTVGASGVFSLASTSLNTFKAGITNNNTAAGSFSVNGASNFNTASQNLSGPGALAFNSDVAISFNSITGLVATNMTVGGNLTVSAGARFNIDQITLLVNGATSVVAAGILSDANAAGLNTFTGAVANAGTFTNSSTSQFIFKNGFTNNNTFTSGTSAYVFLQNPQTIAGTGTTSFTNLTVGQVGDPLNILTLSRNVTVTNLTIVKGIITTGANTLTVSTTTGNSNTTGWVNGLISMPFAVGTNVTNLFPIGDAINYLPVSVVFPSVTTAGSLSMNSIAGDYSLFPGSCLNQTKKVSRYWNVTNASTAPLSYNATFAFANGDVMGSASTAALIGGLYTAGSWSLPTVGTRTANSTILTITANGVVQIAEPATLTPLSYGNGQWNANVYNATDFVSNFSGSFVTVPFTVNTTPLYANALSPAVAPGYVGCVTSTTNNSVRFLRTNITAGTYQVIMYSNDDNVNVIIDGVTVNTRGTSGATTTMFTGNLSPSTLVEVQYKNTGGPGNLSYDLVSYPGATTPISAGSIAGNQSVCTGETPAIQLTNTTAFTVGTCNQIAGYFWQSSTDTTIWATIGGATASTYTIPSGLAVTTWYRRGVMDYCGTAYTTPVKVTVYSTAPGTTTVYGNGTWINYGYANSTFTNYKGYYTEPLLSFDTRNRYIDGTAISLASGYQGCLMPVTNMSVSMKRTNIPAGTYQLNINYQDDGLTFLVNGIQVFQNNNYTPSLQTNVWTGSLLPTDNIEFRWVQVFGGSSVQATFSIVTPAPLVGGTIGGSQSLCSGQIPQSGFTVVSAATSGCSILPTASQWQNSTDSLNWFNIAGATSSTYTVPGAISTNTWYRRSVSDQCGNTALSNIVKITVDNTVYGTPATFPSNQWNFYTYTGYNNFTTYSGYYVEAPNTFATTSRFTQTQSPSFASGYKGCQVPTTNYTVSAKRTGFISSTTGTYQIDMSSLDDVGTLYIDGVSVYTSGCCVAAVSPVVNIYTGPLNAGQTVEWQFLAGGGNNFTGLTVTELAVVPTSLNAGTIRGDQTICAGDIPNSFSTVTTPSGACYFKNYKWQKSIDGGTTWVDLANTNVPSYTPIQSVYVTTQFRRMVLDVCSNPAFSNVVTVTIQNTYPGNPATYGNNQWNVYSYDDNAFGLYIGYYVNPNLTFDTRLSQTYSDSYSYSSNLPPSSAPGYLGCQQTNTQWSAWARRQGVTTAGYYSIDIPGHDDDVFLLINGVNVFQHAGANDSHTGVWTGFLDGTSTIDLKWVNFNSTGYVFIKLNYLGVTSPSNLLAGTLSCSPSSFCPNDYPILTSGTPASSTCFVTYQWQSSPDNVVWSNISGATSLNFNSTTPLGTSTYYRRGAFDACGGGPVYTPACFITPSSPPTPPTAGNGFWNNLVYYSNDFSTNFYGYYTEASLSFLTTNKFASTSPPSVSPTFVGCQLGSQYYSIRMLRTGFTPGTYQIDVNYHDDDVYLLVNGMLINQHIGYGDAHINFWTGNLGATDIVELRYYNNFGPGELRATITTVPLTGSVSASVITGNQTICNGATAAGLTQTTASSSMCFLATQWQSSLNNISYSNIPGATSATYSPGALTQTTYFRRVDSDACGRTANSNVITVTVNPIVNPGTIGTSQTVCNGAAVAAFTETGAASGGNGSYTYQWQNSTDNITFGNIGGATSNVYSAPTLGVTTYYRRTVTSCAGSNNTPVITVTIPPATAITTQPVNYSDCIGATATFNVVAVGNGLTYQWYESTNTGGLFTLIPGATSTSFNKVITGAMSANLYQYRVVVNATCAPASLTSSIATLNFGNPTFTVQPANTTTCNNGNASFNVVATGTGITYQWQIFSGSWTNLTNTGVYSGVNTATLLLTSVNTTYSTNQYRCNVTTSTCGTPTTTSIATLTVQPSVSGNTVTGTPDICSSSTDALTGSAYATLNGGGGVAAGSYTHQWKNSIDNVIFNNIAGATSVNYTTPALTQTTYYQRISSTAVCTGTTASTSPTYTVTVVRFITQPSSATVCPGSTANFSVSTSPGSFTYQWQEFNGSWNNIVSSAGPNATGGTYSGINSASLSIAGITNAMSAFQYRVVVTSGSTNCTSNTATLTSNGIQPAITVQPVDAAICTGGGNISVPLTATGNGLTYVWQVKPPAAGSFSTIANGPLYNGTTTNTLVVLSPGTSFNGYQYRALVSGTCTPSVTSNTITISIYSNVTVNVVSSPQRICSGDTPILLLGSTPSGGIGTYTYQWQSSPDNSAWTPIGGATLINYQPPALASNTYYRRIVTSATCNTNTSASILMTVDPPTTVSAQPAVNTYTCPNIPVTIGITGTGQNLSYLWQLSTDNGSTWNDITSNVFYGNYTTVTLTVKQATLAYNGYQYRARVAGDCGGGSSVVFSNASTLNVYTSPTVVVTPSSATICAGTSTTLVASGANTFAWSPGGLTGASQTLSPASTTIYTVTGTNTATTCSASTTVTVNVNTNPTAFSVGGGGAYCSGGTGPAVSLSGSQIGVSYQLKIGGTNTGSPVLGTGAAISFGTQYSAGTYTVLATNTTTTCFATMTGSTTVSINPIPSMTSSTTSTICSGSNPGHTLSASVASTFSWTLGTNAGAISGGSAASGNTLNQPLTNPSNTTAGSLVYNVTPISITGSCAGSTVGVTVTVNPAPAVTNSTTSLICSGQSPAISLTASISSTYTWTLGTNTGAITGASASSGNTINQVLTNPSTSTPGSIVYIVTPISTTNSCAGSPYSITITVNPFSYTWSGTTNSSWVTGTNWTCGVAPTASTHDAIIPNTTNQPIIPSSPTAIVGSLNITGNTETLSITGTGMLQVHGNWSNSGTFTPNTSTVEFVGSGAQAMSKTTGSESFYNLTVNKTSTLTMNSSANILAGGTLLVQTGTLNVAASKSLTLKSSTPSGALVDNTARLGRVTGTITGTSNFTVERYINAPSTRLQPNYLYPSRPAPTVFLAPAVKGVTVANWSDDMTILFNAKSSTISSYSELNGTGNTLQEKVDKGWRYIMSNTLAISNGTGYKVTAGLSNSNNTVSVTGIPQVGDLNVPITYTPNGTQGWNLVGNPYPCEIDFLDLYNNNSTVIDGTLHIMDPYNSTVNNSTYLVYNAIGNVVIDPRSSTTRTATTGRMIASSQGFLVKALSSVTTANLVFSETNKPTAFGSVYANLRIEDDNKLLRINVNDSFSFAQTLVYFNPNASDGFDLYDSESISSGLLTVTTSIADKLLAINGFCMERSSFSTPLIITCKTMGKKTIKVAEYSGLILNYYLYDKYVNKYTKLADGLSYVFDVNSDTRSSAADRFMIVSTIPGTITGTNETGSIEVLPIEMSLYPNPYIGGKLEIGIVYSNNESHVDIEISNLKGELVSSVSNYKISNGKVELDLDQEMLSAGVYVVKCTIGSHSYVQRLVIAK